MIRADNAELQGIYSERNPYIEEVRLDDAGVVIFDDVFIKLLRKGFSTDCVSDMSEDEQQLLFEFIDYQDGAYTDKYVIALDAWIMNILNCTPNPTINGCAGTSVTFTDCSGTSITV